MTPLLESSSSTVAPNMMLPSASISDGLDDLRIGELALDFGDAAFDEALAFLGGIVVGVLGEIAVRARFGDRLDDRRALDRLQAMQLGLEALRAGDGHGYFAHRSVCGNKKGPRNTVHRSVSDAEDRVARCVVFRSGRQCSRSCSDCIAYGTSSRMPCIPIAAARAPSSVV